jgi:hypothetical protein
MYVGIAVSAAATSTIASVTLALYCSNSSYVHSSHNISKTRAVNSTGTICNSKCDLADHSFIASTITIIN